MRIKIVKNDFPHNSDSVRGGLHSNINMAHNRKISLLLDAMLFIDLQNNMVRPRLPFS